MKVREILRLLRDDGWFLVRQKGSHRQFQHSTKPETVTVAGRPGDDLHPKTAASILKQRICPARSEYRMRYPVIIRRTLTGYSVDVPDLPGCVATGTTVEHARQVIAEAIEMHLDLMRSSRQSVPAPSTSIEFSLSDDDAEELYTWVEVESQEAVSP